RERDVFALVDHALPLAPGVGFPDVDQQKLRLGRVAGRQLLERGRSLTKERAGIAAEYKNRWTSALDSRKLNDTSALRALDLHHGRREARLAGHVALEPAGQSVSKLRARLLRLGPH